MIRETTWSPDTCQCILSYSWDDTEAEDVRQHTFSKGIKLCSEHERLKLSGKSLYTAVVSENTRKNGTLERLRLAAQLSEGADVPCKWSFDAERVLELDLQQIALTSAKKSTLQAELDTVFGENKVRII